MYKKIKMFLFTMNTSVYSFSKQTFCRIESFEKWEKKLQEDLIQARLAEDRRVYKFKVD